MAGIDFESLGITKDDLQERIVEAAVDRLMTDRTEDEDGRSYINKSALKRELEKSIVAHVNEQIGHLATEHVLPRVTEIVDGLTLQETNKWGEARGQKLTFIEYLVQRADAYMREEVDFEGRPKGSDAYNWKASGTRITYLVNKHLHYSIESAMKQALSHANHSITQGLEGAVKIALANATAALKVQVTTK